MSKPAPLKDRVGNLRPKLLSVFEDTGTMAMYLREARESAGEDNHPFTAQSLRDCADMAQEVIRQIEQIAQIAEFLAVEIEKEAA